MAEAGSHDGSRIANVAGAVLVEPGSADAVPALAAALGRFFEEVVAGAASASRDADPSTPLGRLAAMLARAKASRVLVVASSHPALRPSLLLALTAWPECDVVAAVRDDAIDLSCAIYRREPVLEAAQAALADGETSCTCLIDRLDVGRIDGPDLAAVEAD